MASRPSAGFGVQDSERDPQQFLVRIGATSRQLVEVVEDYGISGPRYEPGEQAPVDQVLRCLIDQRRWKIVATPLKNAFNERLKARKYRVGRWETGENRVHRLLGRELCVLLWAIEQCDEDKIQAGVNAWLGLRPEERWWLYAMAAHSAGKAADHDRGWRKAIRFGLTEGAILPETHRSNLLDRL